MFHNPATGNLAAKGSLNPTYADSAHPHAATGLSNGNTYAYNAAGSTVTRVIGADTYSLAYDSENRLKTVQKNGAAMAEFLYDGDGTRVVSTINGVTTKFVGEYYEVTDSSVAKYYGGVAMRKDGALSYLLSDHLGSNSLILDTAGNVVGETRYTAWGEERYSSGSVSTDYTYTGQYSNTDDFGLMYYKARWYDPQLGRFAQADSIVPEDLQGTQAWDRYAYVNNNPVSKNDPSGHMASCRDSGDTGRCGGDTPDSIYFEKYHIYNSDRPTVLDRALKGDVYAILDLLYPTHYGVKVQLEFATELFGGITGDLSGQLTHNRYSDENSFHVEGSISPGIGLGAGGSLTGNAVVGWGSSDIDQVSNGVSANINGTAAAGYAITGNISTPLPIQTDQVYGVVPVTISAGGGYGLAYAGLGGGPSFVLFQYKW